MTERGKLATTRPWNTSAPSSEKGTRVSSANAWPPPRRKPPTKFGARCGTHGGGRPHSRRRIDARLASIGSKNDVKKLKPPGWITPGDLPPIVVGGHKLTDEQSKAVLASLSKSTLGAAQPLVAALKVHVDRALTRCLHLGTLRALAARRQSPQRKVGHERPRPARLRRHGLEADPARSRLAGRKPDQRAVFGLECLRAIGTDVALMQLNGIAQKVSFKGLKAKARELMEAIATDRNLSRTELEDRIVPDCDLDERGSRVFDFGPRQFRFALGGDMKPMVRDKAGKLKDDLPKPGTRTTPRSPEPPSTTGNGSRSRFARSPRSRPNDSNRPWSPAAAGSRTDSSAAGPPSPLDQPGPTDPLGPI